MRAFRQDFRELPSVASIAELYLRYYELAAIAVGYSRTVESAEALLMALSQKVRVEPVVWDMINTRICAQKLSAIPS
jgi:hypothetical protein